MIELQLPPTQPMDNKSDLLPDRKMPIGIAPCLVPAGLTKAGTRCARLCLAEANQLVAKQPDLTEGARGAAYDLCFSRCAASSPADGEASAVLPTRRNRKVAAGGLVAGVTAAEVGPLARAAAPAAHFEHRHQQEHAE